MAADESKETGSRPSRRDLMRAAAGALGAFALAGRALGQQATSRATSQATSRATSQAASQPGSQPASQPALEPVSPPWWMTAYPVQSRVIDLRSETVLSGDRINHPILVEMLERAVQGITDTSSPAEAWKRILGPAQRIVVKFNHVGALTIGTTDAFAKALLENLKEAGYGADTITLVEAPDYMVRKLGTRAAEEKWGDAIAIGAERDELAAFVTEADAIINVPFLKTHQIAGMSGALKNLSHGLIRHPARFHANGCSPYVGQVVGQEAIASRLKVNLVNALRTVVRYGPDAQPADVFAQGGLLVSFDPVAVDTIGRDILLAQRRKLGIVEGIEVRYLDTAHELGVGRGKHYGIERIPISHA